MAREAGQDIPLPAQNKSETPLEASEHRRSAHGAVKPLSPPWVLPLHWAVTPGCDPRDPLAARSIHELASALGSAVWASGNLCADVPRVPFGVLSTDLQGGRGKRGEDTEVPAEGPQE